MIRALLVLAACLGALPASAAPIYSSLYVFGDSLSDNGNAYALSGGIWPPSPPYAGKFSNGPVAAERLAADLGVPLAPSTQGGTNFAVGGATTGVKNYNYEVQSPFPLPATLANTGVLAQVGNFAAASPAFNPKDSLFMAWAGPNDFFLALSRGSSIAQTIASAVGNLATALGQLVGIGARHVLVPNMPNLAETPFGLAQSATDRAALAALSLGFNAALAQGLAPFSALPGLDFHSFDTAALLHEVEGHPGNFGFSNVTAPCFDPASPASLVRVQGGCQGYLFFDSVHLTTAGYALLGDRFYGALEVPEPATSGLLALALAALFMCLGQGRRRQRQAAQGRPLEPEGLSAASPAARSTA